MLELFYSEKDSNRFNSLGKIFQRLWYLIETDKESELVDDKEKVYNIGTKHSVNSNLDFEPLEFMANCRSLLIKKYNDDIDETVMLKALCE